MHEISIPYFLLNDKKISINYFLKSVDNLENLYYTCKAVVICALFAIDKTFSLVFVFGGALMFVVKSVLQ